MHARGLGKQPAHKTAACTVHLAMHCILASALGRCFTRAKHMLLMIVLMLVLLMIVLMLVLRCCRKPDAVASPLVLAAVACVLCRSGNRQW
jgi:hypothetical protein